MGVIYKLKDDVVHFIISQRQGNPLLSCRQLAESASEKFGLRLSKSSVHDVLKEFGIITPRGRKPKDKFKIPQEKKKQIQASLSQIDVGLLPIDVTLPPINVSLSSPNALVGGPDITPPLDSRQEHSGMTEETTSHYQGAGRIFFKAALWDLGIFTEDNIKDTDWDYYLTYSKGVKVVLEKDKEFFIDLPLPLERCIREVADGLVNNVKPFLVGKVSDQELFKACMSAQEGFKINNISIVGRNDHILLEFNNIMEFIRDFICQDMLFVENREINILERSKAMFFPQVINNNGFMNNILNLNGFDITTKDERVVNLLVDKNDADRTLLQQAAEKLTAMCLRDEQGRLVSVKVQ